jgi:hypothetical protein
MGSAQKHVVLKGTIGSPCREEGEGWPGCRSDALLRTDIEIWVPKCMEWCAYLWQMIGDSCRTRGWILCLFLLIRSAAVLFLIKLGNISFASS